MPKLLLLVVITAITVAFFAFDLKQFLSLEQLKNSQVAFQAYYHAHPRLTLLGFFALYVAVAALSLPGTTLLTLAGGALFGLEVGMVVISFASSVGATAAFLVSRYLMRDYVQSTFADKLRSANEGIRQDGAFYLFSLRIIPLFPFFMVNVVMGLTPLSPLTFYWVSQLGMLPGTFVYVNAGTQISHISSVSAILSMKLLFSFALLGIFPLLAKKTLEKLKGRKGTRKYSRPRSYDYNLVVIGAGSAGLVTAYIAVAVKAKVALIEKDKMGGDCLNTGCVPSKALLRSARILSYAKHPKDFGFKSGHFEFEFGEVMERIQRVINKIAPHDTVERYSQLGVDCLQGTAKITSPFTIEVDGRTLTTKSIVIATGAKPIVPSLEGIEKVHYLTSESIWSLRVQPKKLAILGGGPLGCEIAQCFTRLGTQVTLVQKASHLLPREDDEISDFIQSRFQEEGVTTLTQHLATSVSVEGNQKLLLCKNEKTGQEHRVEFDELLIGTGRKPNVSGFGLEELGVRLAPQGTIEVDDFLRTNYPNIYVCGDVAGPYQFTHFGAHQAWYAAVNALFAPWVNYRADYRVIPWVTYTDPEIARVGLNEKEAGEKNIPYEVTRYSLEELDRAITDEQAYGIIKVLTVPGKDKILGVTSVGAHAGEYFIEFVSAMKHGYGLSKILGTIHPYPTLAEANKYVAGVWKKNHAPQNLLRWAKRFHDWRRL